MAKKYNNIRVDDVDGQMGGGACITIGLAQAREWARQQRELLFNGIDPIEARDRARLDAKLAAAKEKTFRDCAEGWMAAQEIGWSPGYAKDVASKLQRFVYPILGDLPVQKVEVDPVHKTLEWLHTKHPPTYSLVQMYIEGTLNWAHAKGYRTGDNPASLKGQLSHLLKPVRSFHKPKHHAALPWPQMGAFMAELRAYKGQADHHARLCKICNSPHLAEIEAARREGVAPPQIAARFGLDGPNPWQVFGRHERWRARGGMLFIKRPITAYALEFLILTAVRREQGVKARWRDIDFDDRIWVCPPESHKAGKTTGDFHIVPLSAAAMAILAEMKEFQQAIGQEDSEFVFITGQSRSRSGHLSVSMINLFMKDYLGRTDCTPHGFRTTFGNWSVEHGYDERDSEMALAHTVGNNVRNIYKRNAHRIEPRRIMMQDWANFCARTEPLDAKVIPMRQGRASSNGNGDSA